MATVGGLDLTQPFTRAQGLMAGLTDAQLRRRAFVRLYRGVYLSREMPASLETRARGALLAAPNSAVISHQTAAVLGVARSRRALRSTSRSPGRTPSKRPGSGLTSRTGPG